MQKLLLSVGIFGLGLTVKASITCAAPTPKFEERIGSLPADSFSDEWEILRIEFGPQFYGELERVAFNKKISPRKRSAAVLALAKYGDTRSLSQFRPLLADAHWMVRLAALKSIQKLGNSSLGPDIIPMLRDPALVVRLEAVETIDRLKPANAGPALMAAIRDPKNYRGQTALWVPERAWQVLMANQWQSKASEELKKLVAENPSPVLKKKFQDSLSKN